MNFDNGFNVWLLEKIELKQLFINGLCIYLFFFSMDILLEKFPIVSVFITDDIKTFSMHFKNIQFRLIWLF